MNRNERSKGTEDYLDDQPVKPEDHNNFIHKAFPSCGYYLYTRENQTEVQRQASRRKMMNIYSCPRASHDRNCLSTRTRPIGNYPLRFPINFKMFDGDMRPDEWPSRPASVASDDTVLQTMAKTEHDQAAPQVLKDGRVVKLPPIYCKEGNPDLLGLGLGGNKSQFFIPSRRARNRPFRQERARRASILEPTDSSISRCMSFKLPKIGGI